MFRRDIGQRGVFAFAAIVALSGCVKRVAVPEAQVDDTVVIARKDFLAMARRQADDSLMVPDSVMFKPDVIFPGDQLGLSLYEKLPISMEKRVELKRVDGRGTIFLLPMGTLKVGGLTTSEAEKFIVQKLSEFVVSPHVEITITERQIGKEEVYLFGKVQKQGSFPMKDGYRLLDLFADAGGVGSSLFARPVKLIRTQGDKVLMTTIDLNDVFRRGQLEQNILLQNQDIVFVPPQFFASAQEVLSLLAQLVPWYYFLYAFGAAP